MGVRIGVLLRGGVLGLGLVGCVEREPGDSAGGEASTGGATDAGSNGASSSGASTSGATSLESTTTGTGGEETTGTGGEETGSSSGSSGEAESSGGSTGTSGGTVLLGFDADVWPIVAAGCGCHLDGNGAGKLKLAKDVAYDNLVGRASEQADGMLLVAPGEVEASYLWFKLNDTQDSVGGSGKRMPPGGALEQAEIEVVAQWIAEGAAP